MTNIYDTIDTIQVVGKNDIQITMGSTTYTFFKNEYGLSTSVFAYDCMSEEFIYESRLVYVKDWAACDFGFVDDVVHTSHTEAELNTLMDKMRGRKRPKQ